MPVPRLEPMTRAELDVMAQANINNAAQSGIEWLTTSNPTDHTRENAYMWLRLAAHLAIQAGLV